MSSHLIVDAGRQEAVRQDSNDIVLLRHLPAKCADAPALLLIHGWGGSSDIWQASIDGLLHNFNLYLLDLPGHGLNAAAEFVTPDDFIDQFARQCLAQLPKSFSIIGWSLGGLLASYLAHRFADQVNALVLVACNQSFLSRPNWRFAMAAEEFGEFSNRLAGVGNQAELAVLLNRFYALQVQGSLLPRQDLRSIKSYLATTDYNVAGVKRSLGWLLEADLATIWHDLTVPVLHQFGSNDALLPQSAGRAIASAYPDHQVDFFTSSAHQPFVSEPENWLERTQRFLQDQRVNTVIDKRAIADSFSNAAKNYDALAQFQHHAGQRLIQLLADIDNPTMVRQILDLGSGTGYFSSSLLECYPSADLIELDISEQMLQFSKSRFAQHNNNSSGSNKLPLKLPPKWPLQIQADIESLPVLANSFELVFSNLAIQWCHNLDAVFQGLANSLVEGGSAAVTTLIDGSLGELKQAWARVDDAVHVNTFAAEDAVQASCLQAGLSISDWQVQDEVQYFDSIAALIRSVKDIGAHNMHPDRPKGLMGKNKYQKFVAALERQKTTQGYFPLSYRVLYIVLKK